MLSLVKANRPAPRNTSRPSRTIGRRVSPNVSKPFEHGWYLTPTSASSRHPRPASRAHCDRGERIAQEQRALGGDEFAGLHAFEDLAIAVVLLRRS